MSAIVLVCPLWSEIAKIARVILDLCVGNVGRSWSVNCWSAAGYCRGWSRVGLQVELVGHAGRVSRYAVGVCWSSWTVSWSSWRGAGGARYTSRLVGLLAVVGVQVVLVRVEIELVGMQVELVMLITLLGRG